MKRRIAFKTLGCRLNQFETSSLATQFTHHHYKIVPFNEQADVYVINTCTVTNQSDHKSRNIISQAARRTKDAVIVVTGCMAGKDKEHLEEEGNITYVVDNNRKSSIFSLIDAHFKGETNALSLDNSNVFDYVQPDKIFKTRGMVKIQDGCDNYCTFCIIPFVRGRAVSRPVKDILNDVRNLVQSGYKEIVVTGVNIGRYQKDDMNFERLIGLILDLPGDFRLRISSMEPEGIGDLFYELIHHPKMTPHLHLCLQSGSDRILQKMGRMYTVEEFLKIVHRIRKEIPNFNFTTDIMVGFPGETEDDLLQTLEVMNEVRFGHVHTFKYSVRDGTRAARMEEHVDEKIKAERSIRIRDLAHEHTIALRSAFIGKEQLLLTEKLNKRGYFSGYGEHYLPIQVPSPGLHSNQFVKVKISGLSDKDPALLNAEVVEAC